MQEILEKQGIHMAITAVRTAMGRLVDDNKLFRVGEPVTFTAQEFSEICWTFLVFGQQLVANLQQLPGFAALQE